MSITNPKTKPRQLKTIYERFSHHRVEDLELLKKEVNERLNQFFEIEEKRYNRHNVIPDLNVFSAMAKLNIPYCGKFYISGFRDGDTKFYSDAECFRTIWEKIIPDAKLIGRDEGMLEVQVIAADHKDACLIIYKDRDSWAKYNLKIIRDKHSELLLEGNIAHVMDN